MTSTPTDYGAYFAFAANLPSDSLLRRCPNAVPIGPARLPFFALRFHGIATVEPDPERVVYGHLWAVDPDSLDALDNFEGFPHLYGREAVTTFTARGTEVGAFTYRLVEPGPPQVPFGGYADLIHEGYTEHSLPLSEFNRAIVESAGGRWTVGPEGSAEAVFIPTRKKPC